MVLSILGGNAMFYTMEPNDFITVTIDNFPSDHWRICLMERPNIPTPKRQIQVDDVLGRLGSFYTKFGYEDMDVQLTFNYLEDVIDFKSWKQQMPHVRRWLAEGKILEFSDEPNTYYHIRKVLITSDIANDMVEYGEFTVTMTLAPFGRVVEPEPVTMLKSPVTSMFSGTMFNASVETSYPRIELIVDSGLWNLTVTNAETKEKYAFQSRHSDTNVRKYVIDSERKVFYKKHISLGTITMLGDYNAPYGFPSLTTGENEVTWQQSGRRLSEFNIYRNMLR